MWTRDSVRDALRNRFYIGEVQYKGTWYEGGHEPIIDRELFEKCQRVREKRTGKLGKTARRNSRVYPLTGIVRCARCGNIMSGWWQSKIKTRYYICRTKRETKQCDQPTIPAEEAEAQVVAQILGIELPPDWRERAERLYNEWKKPNGRDDIKKEKERFLGTLQRVKDMYEMGDLTRAEYQKKRDYYQAKLAALRPPDLPDFEEIVELMADFPGTWKEATPEERKEILHTLLSEVRLDREKGAEIKINPEMEMLFLPPRQ